MIQLTEQGKTAIGSAEATPIPVSMPTQESTASQITVAPEPPPAATATPAGQPLPPKSSISISERKSEIPAPAPLPGKKCKLGHKLISYLPTVRIGADADGQESKWRLYAIVDSKNGPPQARKVAEKSLKPNAPAAIRPITADETVWECSCCRSRNKENPKIQGWYSELESGGKVIATAQYPLGKDFAKLVADRSLFPESLSERLIFYSGSTNLSKGGPPTNIVENSVLKITTHKGEKAVVQFTTITGPTAVYRWKYQASLAKPVETGEGEVRESYSPKNQPDGTVANAADENHMITVEAGDIGFRWSQRKAGASYVYISPDAATVEVLPADAFEGQL